MTDWSAMSHPPYKKAKQTRLPSETSAFRLHAPTCRCWVAYFLLIGKPVVLGSILHERRTRTETRALMVEGWRGRPCHHADGNYLLSHPRWLCRILHSELYHEDWARQTVPGRCTSQFRSGSCCELGMEGCSAINSEAPVDSAQNDLTQCCKILNHG